MMLTASSLLWEVCQKEKGREGERCCCFAFKKSLFQGSKHEVPHQLLVFLFGPRQGCFVELLLTLLVERGRPLPATAGEIDLSLFFWRLRCPEEEWEQKGGTRPALFQRQKVEN